MRAPRSFHRRMYDREQLAAGCGHDHGQQAGAKETPEVTRIGGGIGCSRWGRRLGTEEDGEESKVERMTERKEGGRLTGRWRVGARRLGGHDRLPGWRTPGQRESAPAGPYNDPGLSDPGRGVDRLVPSPMLCSLNRIIKDASYNRTPIRQSNRWTTK